jgi:hypothetical protein
LEEKSRIKDRWPKPSKGRQKRKAKERLKDEQPVGTKKGRKPALLKGES